MNVIYLKKMTTTKIPNMEKHPMCNQVKFSVTADFHSLNGTRSLSTIQRAIKIHINAKDAMVTTGLQLICPRMGILKDVHKLSS